MKQALGQLAGYFVTGGTAALVDIGLFAILYRLGVPILLAATLSFCLAAIVNYALSARFVFNAEPSARGFGAFFAVALIGLSINVGMTMVFSGYLQLAPELAKVGGIGVAFLANFALNRFLVFRR